jgi:3-hydroxyisobutyrate dehydrogenase-like beta-hydroxyacid dehydrogenase
VFATGWGKKQLARAGCFPFRTTLLSKIASGATSRDKRGIGSSLEYASLTRNPDQQYISSEQDFRMFKSESSGFATPEVTSDRQGESHGSNRELLMQRIGFVGLGHMGTAMAANLSAAGYSVTAYVRRPDFFDNLVALGIKPTTDITSLFDCEIVISMLPDDAAVRETVFGRADLGTSGLAAGLIAGAIHLSMSTISTTAASDLAREHADHGQGYVAAPVFGNPIAAAARELFIVAAGAPADVNRCQPLLERLGQRTFVLGTDPAYANLVKLLGNMMTATALEVLGEAVALLLKRGFDPKPFVDIMTGTMFGGRAHKIYGDKILTQSYAAGFGIPLALKDVHLALAEAELASAPMPSVSVVRDRLITGIERGYTGLDWTALGLIAAEEAGLHLIAPAAQFETARTQGRGS